MREIKFRVKNNHDNKWSYFNLSPRNSLEMFFKEFPFEYLGTLSQYIGLKDKNGKEIYEGDIVNAEDDAVSYKNAVINWINGGFVLMEYYKNLDDIFSPIIVGDFHVPNLECTIIGNIYENPELMEKIE